MCFFNDFSKYTWLFPLKHKSDIFNIFIEFHKRAKRQFSQKLCAFQSDWGGEFQSLNKYLKDHGIYHRVSCPYTQQNGTTERKHKHIIETSLALLKEDSLPKTFGDEAVTTTSFLINRMPTPHLGNQSPFELLFKQVHDYNFFKTFGCLCYPHLRAYTSHKLDYRSEKCVFLGYSSMHLGYHCLSLLIGKIYISRDVIFDENDLPKKVFI